MDELARAIAEIQQKVRARHPQPAAGQIELADLTPVVHARDIAQAKIAGIGRVNPRAGGLLNSLIQMAKRIIARSLGWLVRDQIEFNRGTVECVEALIEAHNAHNRAIAELASRLATIHQVDLPEVHASRQEFHEIRSHWHEWRKEWDRRLTVNEAQFMRSIADLRIAYEQRLADAEAKFGRDVAIQHRDYLQALDRATSGIQERLWADMKKLREEKEVALESLIHHELRLLRQRPGQDSTATLPQTETDYVFADRFRGPEKDIRKRFLRYVSEFSGCSRVLDLGCGRGEFLSLLPAAAGIDLNTENIRLCQTKGLSAQQADMFEYLAAAPDQYFDGIFCAQVIEHLTPGQVPKLVELCAAKLKPGSPIVFETPNPECLAIFATHFFIDPTHTRPVPPALLHYYLTEKGFGRIRIERLGTAANEFPELSQLPEGLRQRFFGALDYAAIARRLH